MPKTSYIVLDYSKPKCAEIYPSFPVINKETYNCITIAGDVMMQYAIDNSISIDNLGIMEVKPIDSNLKNSLALSTIIEWSEEIREAINGNVSELQKPCLNFDIGTPLDVVILWIMDKTGFDLSIYFHEALKN